MNYSVVGTQIIENIGGEKNVVSLEHCSTRLRFQLVDKDKVNQEKLKAIKGVAGIKDQVGGIQVIIGTEVDDVFNAIMEDYTFAAEASAQKAPEQPKNPIVRFMNTLADCFVPLIPALIACGLMSAVVTLIESFGWMDTTGTTFQILNIMGDAPLYFIPFMLAYTAAKKFNVNPFITMCVVATLVYPDLAGLAADGASYISFFGLPVRMATYTSSIIPVLLAVFAQIYIEKAVNKIVPKMFATFLNPLLIYFVLTLVVLVVLGPIATYISDGLAVVLNLVVGKYNWLVCMVLGAVMIPLISTGLHYSLMPIIITNFAMNGYDTFWAGPSFAANMALAGAVLAIAVFSKDKDKKQVASSTGFTALLGITEPAIYSVAFTNRKVLLAACIAGGIGGLISGILGVNSYGMAPAGLPSIAVLVGPTFAHAIIAIVASLVLGFIISAAFEKKAQN